MRRILIVMISVMVGLLAATGPAVAHPRGIPDRLMLQPDDLGGAVPEPVEKDLAWPLLPRPCADRPIPQPVATRTRAATYNTRYRVYQNVARFRADGAQRYLTDLKTQLTDCGVGGADNGFDPVAEDHLGPNTVLFQGNYDQGDRWVAYVAAAVGRHVAVIMVSDAQVGAGDPTTANGLAQAAMTHLSAALKPHHIRQ